MSSPSESARSRCSTGRPRWSGRRSSSLDDLAHAVPVARALVAGGLPVIELTLRTPVALDAIAAIAAEVPEILVGAGTIISPELGSSSP